MHNLTHPVQMLSVLHPVVALVHQILTKLRPPLIDTNSMANHLGRAPRRIGELTPLHPRRLEPRHRVDRVKQAQELDPPNGPGESLAEALHELVHLPLLPLPLGIVLARVPPALPLREGLPRERDHLLVPVAQQPDVVQHLGQEARDVRPAAEAEYVDLVARAVEPHQEAVPAHDVLVKGGADRAVLGFHVP